MKSKWALLALVLTMSVLLAACGGSNESKKESSGSSGGSKASASAGEELYQQSCIGCHGKDLEGGGGPNLQEVGGKYDEAKIESIIKNGRGNMPSHLVNDKEAAEIAKWLSQKK
ncbi:cytochrome c551 [Bacillus velezensis]|uniref:cytochrome c551 n=1 Tax=Bacillus velezensis TaxID=492670 RepID=UPI002E1A531B|nr:cytochrome c [Bacillus velezensis]MED3675577.1 cytochrome c [Bacillus velezensis]